MRVLLGVLGGAVVGSGACRHQMFWTTGGGGGGVVAVLRRWYRSIAVVGVAGAAAAAAATHHSGKTSYDVRDSVLRTPADQRVTVCVYKLVFSRVLVLRHWQGNSFSCPHVRRS